MIDRPLPSNLDAERAVLGAVLLDNAALSRVAERLNAGDFFLPQHRLIFVGMMRLAEGRQPIDTISLVETLNGHGELENAGGAAYLSQLADGLPRVMNLEHYGRIITEKADLRRLAYLGEAIREAALSCDHEAAIAHMIAFQGGASSSSILRAVAVEELLASRIKPREMLLDPILPEQGLAMLYSYRGVGKTYLALGIAAAVSSGARFLRWSAPRSRRVLYVDGELAAKTLQERLAMIVAGIEGGEPAPGTLRIITPDFQERPIPDLATAQGQRQLEPHLAGIDLLVLDNLSALCRYGNENEGEDWLPVQNWALGLRRRGVSVLFVHHAGKNKSQRGTSRREDLLDTVITLKHSTDYNASEGLRCEVHFEKTRSMLGNAARPCEVRMESGQHGRAIWTWRELEDAKAEQAAALFSAHMSVRDVAEELGISKSQAGRYRQKWAAEIPEVSRRPTA
ncbi:MAG TPA: DnaB-like helicase N-terminal domain-containing protein [Candidatus Sulfotelmatobacter sp.]|nr:DnaB-like helicase N-terminal domain-containing protein [Candidatus Sulfotelmatobacter sp.]